MIKVGLPKGVVKQNSLNLIKKIFRNDINRDKLYFYSDNVSFYLLKHRDITKLVYDGILDFGITSSEWVLEFNKELEIIRTLDWCDTRISLVSNKNNPVLTEKKISCITEFPNIAAKFFSQQNFSNVEIQHISGSSESLVPTLFDCCIDCVETGKTLKIHDLVEEKVIYESKIVVISRKNVNEEIIDCINIVLREGEEI